MSKTYCSSYTRLKLNFCCKIVLHSNGLLILMLTTILLVYFEKSNLKNHPGTHDENRRKICLFCCKKKGRNGASKIIVITLKGKIESLVNSVFKYEADDKSLPNGICSTCLNKLYEAKKTEKKLLEAPKLSFNYKNIKTRVEGDSLCQCLICQLARKTHDNFSKNKPRKNSIVSNVMKNNLKGQYESNFSKNYRLLLLFIFFISHFATYFTQVNLLLTLTRIQ